MYIATNCRTTRQLTCLRSIGVRAAAVAHIAPAPRTDRSGQVMLAVATATTTWRDTARAAGASAEITRMASAFEHDDLKQALAL